MRQMLEMTADGMNAWSDIAEDPFVNVSTLHPNADSPIKVSWTLQDTQTRFGVIISGTCALYNKGWTGSLHLTATIEQGANHTTREFVVTGDQSVPWGLAFENDQSPFTLTFALRLGDNSDLANSAVCFSAISAVQPIHENGQCQLIKLYSAGENSTGALINANQGGLMNRIISLFSTISIARQTGRDAYVWWGTNAHCAARFQDLFATGTLTDPSVIADDCEVVSMYEADSPPLDLTSCKRNVVVHAVSPIKTQPAYPRGFAEIAEGFRQTPLAAPVKALLAQFDGIDFSRCIAFHIRRPFPGGAFAELENSKFTLGIEVFINLISGLKRDFPGYDRVLVCTNNFDVERQIRAALGDYVFFFDKTTVDNTTDARAVQEAMVDVMLMSRCPILFSQETTAFGFFAHLVGRNCMFAVLKTSTPDDLKIWRFEDGKCMETIEVPAADLSHLKERAAQVTLVAG
jgi:hypothetical protein